MGIKKIDGHKIGPLGALSLVVANMVGTGVFTSLGYQVKDIKSGFAILCAWFLGGMVAITGALCYAEISTLLKRSGGEYNYLSEIYHPALGFLAGWISFIAGFAAPICAVGMAIGVYSESFIPFLSPLQISALCIVLVTSIHLVGVKESEIFLNIFTALKIFLILIFCTLPLFADQFVPTGISFAPTGADMGQIFKASFAVNLVYVYYSYSGWNASAYVAGIIKDPNKNLPLSLLLGTIFVIVIYLIINWVFLIVAPMHELAGKLDIGHVVANKLFGANGARLASALISLSLISTLSALILLGPRVAETIGEDYPLFQKLSNKNKKGSPYLAVVLQSTIALLLLFTTTYEFVGSHKPCGT